MVPQSTVLIVTPDANLRAAAARVLAREDYRVLTAAHAGHALLACLREGHLELLAVESSMDGTSGRDLAEQLRRYCPGLAVVFFASDPAAAGEDVLVRPFTRDDLLAALATARAAADAWEPISAS